jgi:hypothetical protein
MQRYTIAMKKTLYVFLFTTAALLLTFLVHAVLEISILWWIQNNFDVYGSSYVWQNWSFLHLWVGRLLWVIGLVLGVYGGFRYWDILYIEQRYGQPRW